MRSRFLAVNLVAMLVIASCQSVRQDQPVGQPEPDVPAQTIEAAPIGTVQVDASALNIRSEPSMSGEVLTQVERGERLPLMESGDSWMMVRLPDGRTGWAAARFLLRDGQKSSRRTAGKRGCPPDSDFAFVTAPTPAFSELGPHGKVVVEAHVGVDGKVKSTKLIRNSTGDEALALRAEREIKSATFIAPVQNCVVREFIYTYEREF